MSNIDWSKAPEGATHYGDSSGGYVECWYRIAGGELEYKWADSLETGWRSGGQRKISSLIARPDSSTSEVWQGTGLPPVGCKCEIDEDSTGKWLSGEVIAHGRDEGKDWAIVQCDDAVWMGEAHELRPLRTQEQIEAEERWAAVKAMLDLDPPHESGFGLTSRQTFCETLYDAGYRKQPKEDA